MGSDEELINECLLQKGHSFTAFKTLVDRYENQAFRTALFYVRNAESAEEMTQESFLSVYNNLHRLENKANFKAWLMRIVKNQCLDYLRLQKKVQLTHITSDLENLPDEVDSYENLDALIQSIQELDPENLEVLTMYYFSELSVKEMAEELGIGESAVKMRLMRAREKLEKMIAKK